MEEQEDKIKETADERIDAFLRGEMSPDERKAFLAELAADESLRQRAAAMALLVKTMHKIGRENDEKVMSEVTQQPVAHKPVNFQLYVKRVLAVAACLCIIFTVYDYQEAKMATGDLATQYLSTYTPKMPSAEDIDRSRSDEAAKQENLRVLSELTTLFNAVTAGTDNQQSLASLQEKFKLASAGTYNEYIQYYRQIGYYLAIAYLKDNDRKSAKATLTEVLKNEPDFTEAKQLLDEINDIHFIFE